jgi:hypothetical protein
VEVVSMLLAAGASIEVQDEVAPLLFQFKLHSGRSEPPTPCLCLWAR